MLSLLVIEKPSVVVSTYPFASSVLSKLKEAGLTTVPLVTVITDHTHHSYWLHSHTDQYIVGSNEIKEKLIRTGIPAEKIAATGIPIRSTFLKKKNPSALLEKFGLDKNRRTIMIMGGGEGLIGKGLLNRNKLEQFPEPLQLLVLCGHNEKLKERLQIEFSGSKHMIKLIGYTDLVDELMAVSDILITKPGGVTTSEAAAMELPMLLYKPLPGQEQDNARYLTDAGAAILVKRPDELFSELNGMLKNELLLARMKENCRKIQTNRSSFYAVRLIVDLMDNRIFVPANLSKQRKFGRFGGWRKTILHG